MWICKHCAQELNLTTVSEKANHSRWCEKNPKRESYTTALAEKRMLMVKAKQSSGITNQFTKAKINGTPLPEGYWKNKVGTFSGKTHSDETKELLRSKALASPHRRLRRKMIEYRGVMLESSWELALAQRLDDLGIEWIRPGPIQWVDEERRTHHYFPDFFLPKYNLYLDPKNPQAVKVQKKKLDILMKQHHNIMILSTLTECKNFNIV